MLNWLVVVIRKEENPILGIVRRILDGDKELDVRFWDNVHDFFVSEWYPSEQVILVARLSDHELLLRPEDALRNHLPDIVVGLFTEVSSLKDLSHHHSTEEGGGE